MLSIWGRQDPGGPHVGPMNIAIWVILLVVFVAVDEPLALCMVVYHKVSNIRCTKSENLSDCRLVLQLPLANPLKPGVKLRMKM